MGNGLASQEDNGNLEHSEGLRDFESVNMHKHLSLAHCREERNEMRIASLADYPNLFAEDVKELQYTCARRKNRRLKLPYSGPIN
jgi:hypothetical protein